MSKRHGEIEEAYEERDIEWKITAVSSLINSEKKFCNSPSFSFAGNSWLFQLHPNSAIRNGFMCLYLYKVKRSDYSVDYTYGVKKLDGRVQHLGGGIFIEGNTKYSGPCHFIKLSEFEKQKSNLAPSDVFTLTCKLKRGIPNSHQPKLKKLRKLDTLSENFKDLFAHKESCDTTLRVQDREYRVHRAVLIARSSVFAAMFQHDTKEKETNTITIPDCDPESFGEFLEFLYCGKLEELSFRSALQLYVTSDKYDVLELKAFCVDYLIENFTVENVCDIVILADKYDDTKLFSEAQECFNKNLFEMLHTPAWECLLKNNYHLANKLLKALPKAK